MRARPLERLAAASNFLASPYARSACVQQFHKEAGRQPQRAAVLRADSAQHYHWPDPRSPALFCVCAADMESMGWTLGKELGSGHFAKVYLVTRKTDGVEAACKIIKKPKELKKRALVAMEHKILTEVEHPSVVKCYDAFETGARRASRASAQRRRSRPRLSTRPAVLRAVHSAAQTIPRSSPLTPACSPRVLATLPCADDRLYLFMECMYGGELFDRIVDLGHFTEKMAQDVSFKL